MNIDEQKLQQFMNQAVGELGAAASIPLMMIGERLGLYKAMAELGPVTSEDLAKKTGTAERYVREWLLNQTAGGITKFDPSTNRYTLPAEQACALADETSPFYLHGAFQVISSMFKDQPKIQEVFKSGKGVPWGEHDHELFEGTERFFRAGYRGNLMQSWIPALEGVEDKLKSGGKVADVGCGYGASTILMAQAFPKSQFVGFDYHEPSIAWARKQAERAGVSERVKFEKATSTDFPGRDYDFVAFFDCLHDMADPIGAAKRVRDALAPEGVWMVVEPMAGDSVEQNANPVGRLFSAASTMICVPCSLAANGPALGAQAGEKRLREVISKAGFTRIRRATETPFNMILEARP